MKFSLSLGDVYENREIEIRRVPLPKAENNQKQIQLPRLQNPKIIPHVSKTLAAILMICGLVVHGMPAKADTNYIVNGFNTDPNALTIECEPVVYKPGEDVDQYKKENDLFLMCINARDTQQRYRNQAAEVAEINAFRNSFPPKSDKHTIAVKFGKPCHILTDVNGNRTDETWIFNTAILPGTTKPTAVPCSAVGQQNFYVRFTNGKFQGYSVNQ